MSIQDKNTKFIIPLYCEILDYIENLRSTYTRDQAADDFETIIKRDRILREKAFEKEANKFIEYAIVSLIDDILSYSEWGKQVGWSSEQLSLEYKLYNTANTYSQFYANADEARQSDNSDVLLVYLQCVLLGFRGKYREKTDELKKWVMIQNKHLDHNFVKPGRPFYIEDEEQRLPVDELNGVRVFIRSGVMSCICILLTLLSYFYAVQQSLK